MVWYLGQRAYRSIWGVRELIWSGKIPVIKDGRKMFIDILDLEKYVENNKMTYT
jgi:hypothetical protein